MNIYDKKIKEIFKNFEILRTVEEMEIYYSEIVNLIGNDRGLIEYARLGESPFKELYNEFLPILKFAKSEYGIKNCKYNIVVGNQNYDGIVQGYNIYRKIEISKYFDGKKQKKIAIELNSKGSSRPFFGDEKVINESIRKYINNFLYCVNKKKEKNYENTDIIFVVDSREMWPFVDEISKNLIVNEIKLETAKIFDGSNGIFILIEKYNDIFPKDIVIKIC